MSRSLSHFGVALLTIASLVASPVFGQAPQTQPQAVPVTTQPAAQPTGGSRPISLGPDYSKAPSFFPNIVAPYVQHAVPEPVLTNSPRIDQLIQNGVLNLSLDDAISLALENNMDIAVQRFTPWLDAVNLLRSESGVNGRIPFDPTLTSTLSLAETNTPINNPILSGIGTTGGTTTPTKLTPSAVEAHSAIANFQYSQNFSLGTQFLATFNNQRASTSVATSLLNPAFTSSLSFQITQPLLNGFGKLPNLRYILEAKNTLKVGVSQLAQQVMTTITQVANDYWELVYARQNVKVEQTAVAADQQLYDNNKKQLEIGTMAPLDVLTAESQLATDQQGLVQAQSVQLQDETTLLVAITKNSLVPSLAGVEINPTTPIFTPEIDNISLQDAVNEAWQKRPELQQANLNLANTDIEVKATRNALLPVVNLFGLYTAQGIGGVQKTTVQTATGLFLAGQPVVTAAGGTGTVGTPVLPAEFASTAQTAPTLFVFPGGIGDDWSRLFSSHYPTFQAGINITLPIRNRAAQAANATALLDKRLQDAQYRQTQNTILLAVRNSLIALAQDRAALKAAAEAHTLNQQSYDDEVKRLQLGTSTAFTVTQKQQLLVAAEGTELRDEINLIEAEVNLNQAIGRTLEVNRIVIPDVKP
jgi:outer membrane protein